MPDLFGAAGGLQQWNNDQQTLASNALGMDNTKQQMQERAVDIQQKQLNLARTQALTDALRRSAMGNPGGDGEPKNPLEAMSAQASNLRSQADTLMRAGFPDEAMKMYTEAGKMETQRAGIISHEINDTTKQIDAGVKKAKLANDLLGNVIDEASWKDAARQYAQATGDKSYMNMPYDPSVVARLHARSMTAYQQGELKLSTLRTQAELDRTASTETHQRVMEDLARNRDSREEARAQRLNKVNGVKAATAATSKELEAANTEIDGSGIKGLSTSDKARFASYIAGAAKKMVADNPSLDYAEALTRAKSDYIKSGELLIARPDKDGTVPKGATHFTPGAPGRPGIGNNVTTPLPLSAAGEAKDGQYFSTPQGVVRFNGKTKKFALVDAGTGAPAPGPEAGDEDEEEE